MVFARSVLRMRTCQEDDERGEREREEEREGENAPAEKAVTSGVRFRLGRVEGRE